MTDEQATDPESWLDRHGDALYRYALLRLRAPDATADVVQETFVEALRARHSFVGRSSERTWLIGILRHKIVDHLRRSGRERATGDGVPEEAATATAAGPAFDRRGHWRAGPASWSVDPVRDLESREFWEVLQGCLSRLPPGLSRAFVLRELEGMDAEETRRALGITPANLWARLHRARMLLRGCLESRWFGRREAPPPPFVKEAPVRP
jgi:RNA polymerase sigma-70 factor (ECF subfamily)